MDRIQRLLKPFHSCIDITNLFYGFPVRRVGKLLQGNHVPID